LIALAVGAVSAQSASGADPSQYGIQSFSASLSSTQAGGHPDFTTDIGIKTDSTSIPFAPTRNLEIELPPGLIGNPAAFPACTAEQLTNSGTLFELKAGSICPIDSQVGVAQVTLYNENGGPLGFSEPIYNMVPPGGDVVARLGLIAETFATFINVRLDPERDYSLTATVEGAGSLVPLVSAQTTLWGLPAAPSHDSQRITPEEAYKCSLGGECSTGRPSDLQPPGPFMTNPTRCGLARQLSLRAMSYADEANVAVATASLPKITGCGLVPFHPQVSYGLTTSRVDSPSGMEVHLSIPQEGLFQPNLLANGELKKTVVVLPDGLTLNPSAAAGLGACTESQVGLISEAPIRFSAADSECPNSAKVGTVEIETPVLREPIQGSLYLASQTANPFGSLLAGYLVAQGEGVVLKLAGHFDVGADGRITAVFDDNPEQPFSHLRLRFKGGPHGVLTTPPACGSYDIESLFVPWSAAAPFAPQPPESVLTQNAIAIDSGAEGGDCVLPPARASLEAGVSNPVAGQFSPFLLRLSRGDGTQRFGALDVELPAGLVASLRGIPYCSESAIAAARARSRPGEGALELTAPSCPADSQIGTVGVGVGTGPDPFSVSTGRMYLAGPYNGGPVSVVVIAPATTGPFDLGDVVVRTALVIDPETLRVRAVSEALPSGLAGIQLDVRDIRLRLDRRNFTLNPTNCAQQAIRTAVTSPSGSVANSQARFQVAGCRGLKFNPSLQTTLVGPTHRGGHPKLRALLKTRPGNANIGGAQVTLPHSEFLAQEHIRTVCTRKQFAADQCPAGAIYGHARAFSPLLDGPLEGPVYLRSSSHPLPDLVAALKGQIDVDVVGRIDSVHGGIRTTFAAVPDAPVSKFSLVMFGGSRGLLSNSRDLCRGVARLLVRFVGQNGATRTLRPPIHDSCGAKHGKHRKANHNHRK
jgi:hypothetical protein